MAFADQSRQCVGGLAVLVDGGVETLRDEGLITGLGEVAGGIVGGLGPSADLQFFAQLQFHLHEAGQFPAGLGSRLFPSQGLEGRRLVIGGWPGCRARWRRRIAGRGLRRDDFQGLDPIRCSDEQGSDGGYGAQ